MITLNLLHPLNSTTMQKWSFDSDPIIRIGRAEDNHVVLYSSVVSRYHLEIRQQDKKWEIVGLGTNGTYVDGQLVAHAPVVDGIVVRLAASGPKLQISLEELEVEPEINLEPELGTEQKTSEELPKQPLISKASTNQVPRETYLIPPKFE